MTKLQDARFRKTNFAFNKEKVFDFDADMLKILMAIDENKTVLQIAREVKMDTAVFKEKLLRLFKLKVIEEVKEKVVYVDQEFIERLKEILVSLVGPLGEMLVEVTAEKMNYQVSGIPKNNVSDFVYEIAREIPGEKQQAEFKQLIIQEIKKMT